MKKFNLILTMLIAFGLTATLSAQSNCMTCYSSGSSALLGNVGIGVGPGGSHSLTIYNTAGNSINTTATQNYCEAIYARATGTSGTGVYGKGYKGIHGVSASSSGYAGYFSGNVYVSGTISSSSDKKLKQNIKPIHNALSTILQLEGKAYQYRTAQYKELMLAEGIQFGFLAQDLETILPELVSENEQHVFSESDEGEKSLEKTIEFKSVNYIAIIPILTEAIKEQNTLIEDQQELINQLQARMDRMEGLEPISNDNFIQQNTEVIKDKVLKQNTPNPFSDETIIEFELPKKYQEASIIIHDMQGKQIKQYNLEGQGNSSIAINGGTLENGIYFYSLVIDNAVVNTLKMILTK